MYRMNKQLQIIGIYTLIICYFLYLMRMISNDVKSFKSFHNIIYVILTIIPLVLCAIFLFHSDSTNYIWLLSVFGLCTAVTLLVYLDIHEIFEYIWRFIVSVVFYFLDLLPKLDSSFGKEAAFIFNVVMRFTLFFAIIIAFTIGYNAFGGSTEEYASYWFYLPCLITDAVEYLKKDFQNTPSVIFILLVLEFFILFFLFAIPLLIRKLNVLPGVELLRDPHSINTSFDIGHQLLFQKVPELNIETNSWYDWFQRKNSIEQRTVNLENYALSFWFSSNVPSGDDHNVQFPVLQVGTLEHIDDKGGYPYITMSTKGELHIVCTNTINKDDLEKYTITTRIPFQKWNYIVLNYQTNRVDLFINGHLEQSKSIASSLPLRKTSPTQNKINNIRIGSNFKDNNNNTNSYLCNLNFFDRPLVKSEISRTFNLLKTQNPPLNNI